MKFLDDLNPFKTSSSSMKSKVESMKEAELSLLDCIKKECQKEEEDIDIETLDTSIQIDTTTIPLSNRGCTLPFIDNDHNDQTLMIHSTRITINQKSSSSTPSSLYPLVLCHGYMNGSMAFYRNVYHLAKYHFGTVYLVDSLGWGLSSRPYYHLHKQPKDKNNNSNKIEDGEEMMYVALSEDFFTQSFEAWRREMNKNNPSLNRMVLGGHSMGGYLCIPYCEQYPQHVETLLLLSPVGVPLGPKTDETTLSSSSSWSRRLYRQLMSSAFQNNMVSPGMLLRSPLIISEIRGKERVQDYVQSKFAPPIIPNESERFALSNYFYYNNVLPGSAEYCVGHLLTIRAFAKRPLLYRIPKLNVKSICFIYGQNDWMDADEGGLMVQKLCDQQQQLRHTTSHDDEMKQQQQQQQQQQTILSSPPQIKVYGIRNAGHMFFLENPRESNMAMIMGSNLDKIMNINKDDNDDDNNSKHHPMEFHYSNPDLVHSFFTKAEKKSPEEQGNK